MDEAIVKIIKVLVFGIVAWAISAEVFNILYESIDNAITSSGENVTDLLKAMTQWRVVLILILSYLSMLTRTNVIILIYWYL